MLIAKYLLLENGVVKNVASELGFMDSSIFGKHFRRFYGVSPTGFLQDFATRQARYFACRSSN